jgi:hypothetical protein
VSGVRRSHGADEGAVALEHAVEERHQLVDLVIGPGPRHARTHIARLDNAAHGGDDPANRFQGAVGEKRAAAEADGDNGNDAEEKDGAEVAQQFVAIFRGAAHRHDGSVAQGYAADGPDHVLLGRGPA